MAKFPGKLDTITATPRYGRNDMSDPTPTPEDMTVVSTKISTFFAIQREKPDVPGEWEFWSRRMVQADAEVVCNTYATAFPNENYRVRRAFQIITLVVEN